MKKYFYLFLLLTIAFSACKPKIKEQPYHSGSMNPDRFVMLGGTHSSGYMDDGLYTEGQLKSVSNLLAKQLQLVGAGVYNQALVSEQSMGISLAGLSPLYLGYKTDCLGNTSLSPVRIAQGGDNSILSEFLYNASSPFADLNIPGLKLQDLVNPNYSLVNPFYARMASSAGSTVLEDALLNDPSFFSLFLGIDDVMEYAKSGGTVQSLPEESEFYSQYSAAVQLLTSNGAKGILATLPELTQMPYFTTIPYNSLTLDAANAQTLNAVYNPLGFYFQVGNNPFMMVDSTANQFAVRQMLESDLLLLSVPLDSIKCNQMGVLFPIRDEFILDAQEREFLQMKIQNYNNSIRSIAAQYNLAVVETGDFVNKLKDSFVYNGVTMSSTFVSGGAYSLDGIHFTPRGNALLANEFIKSINQHYGARIPEINAGNYRAVLFPQ